MLLKALVKRAKRLSKFNIKNFTAVKLNILTLTRKYLTSLEENSFNPKLLISMKLLTQLPKNSLH